MYPKGLQDDYHAFAKYATDYFGSGLPYFENLMSVLNSPIGDITDRGQIINPYAIIDVSQYKNTAKGHALYDQHLNALLALQAKQQAMYDEWYNSEEQQIFRQRESGLNPDLNGIQSAQAPEVNSPSASPLEGVPTSGQQLGNIASLVGSVASVAALPFSIGSSVAQMSMSAAQKGLVAAQTVGVAAQTAGQQIANVSAFEGSVYAAMAANLANAVGSAAEAGTKFNFNSWINDPNSTAGIFESYAPSDNPQYRAAFDRAKQNLVKVKGPAYALNADAVGQQTNFAQGLSNPYYDPNLLVQVAGLEPTMDAIEQIRIAKQNYFDKVRIAKEDYVANLDPAAMAVADVDKAVAESTKAEFDALISEVNYIVQNAQKTIRMNYMDMYKKDPNSLVGLTGAYMVMDGMHMKFGDWLLANGLGIADDHVDNPYMPQTGSKAGNSIANPFGVPNMRYLQEQAGRISFTPPGGTYVPTF